MIKMEVERDTYRFTVDCLFGSFEQLINYLLRLEGNEAEPFSLVLCLIEGHFDFNNLQNV